MKDLIRHWDAKGDQFDYFRLPLEVLLTELENGSFYKRSIENQKAELFGIRGQYLGKGEVLALMIPDSKEYPEYHAMLGQIITNYVDQLD